MKKLENVNGVVILHKKQQKAIMAGDACPSGLCLTFTNGLPRCVRCGEEPPPDR